MIVEIELPNDYIINNLKQGDKIDLIEYLESGILVIQKN